MNDVKKIEFDKVFKRHQQPYFHIGVKGLTNEITNDKIIVIGSRPAMGEKELLTKIAYGALINKNKVAYFSPNITSLKLTKELFARPLECSYHRLKDYNIELLYEENKNDFNNMYIFDNKYSFKEVYNKIVNLDYLINGLDIVIIDSLEDYIDDEHSYIGIFRILHDLSTELNIRFIVHSKLKRNLEKRINKIPKLHDLKFDELYYINKIILLYRESYYNEALRNNELVLELFCYNQNAKYIWVLNNQMDIKLE